MSAIPAVVFRNSSVHRPYHCQVLVASLSRVRLGRTLLLLGCRWRPAWRVVPVRRVLHEAGGAHHGDQVHDSKDRERAQGADLRDEPRGDRRRDQCAASETGDRDAGDHPPSVREPLHQRRHRDDISEAEADPTDQPVGVVEQPEPAACKAGEEDAQPIEYARGQRHLSWAHAPHPEPTAEGRKPQDEDRDREGEGDLGDRPAVVLGDRNPNDTPLVDRAERNLHDDAGKRNHPTVGHGCHVIASG